MQILENGSGSIAGNIWWDFVDRGSVPETRISSSSGANFFYAIINLSQFKILSLGTLV